MLELIAVFVAGGTGACFRLLLGRWVDLLCAPHLPNAGILAANLLGSLAIGFGSALLPDGVWRVALLTGLLGGFTTYSAFALLTVNIAGAGRWGLLAIQLGVHLIGGVLCVLAGVALARLVRGA